MAQRLEAALKRPLNQPAGAPARPDAPAPDAQASTSPGQSASAGAPAPEPEFDLAAAVAAELNLDTGAAGDEGKDEAAEKKTAENVSIYDEILKRDS